MFYNIVNFSIYLQFAKQRKMHEQYVRMSFMPKWTSCIYLFVYRALSWWVFLAFDIDTRISSNSRRRLEIKLKSTKTDCKYKNNCATIKLRIRMKNALLYTRILIRRFL